MRESKSTITFLHSLSPDYTICTWKREKKLKADTRPLKHGTANVLSKSVPRKNCVMMFFDFEICFSFHVCSKLTLFSHKPIRPKIKKKKTIIMIKRRKCAIGKMLPSRNWDSSTCSMINHCHVTLLCSLLIMLSFVSLSLCIRLSLLLYTDSHSFTKLELSFLGFGLFHLSLSLSLVRFRCCNKQR